MAFSFPKVTGKQLITDPWPFVATWVVSGLLAIFIPIIHWTRKKNEYYRYYGYAVEYEQAQRAYEEANNGNNNNNYNYASNCSWWQWKCRKNAYYYAQNNGDGNGEDQVNVPNWYLFIGGQTEEQRRQKEEMGEVGSSGAIKFVYWWTLILFVGILAYGVFVLSKGYQINGLRLALFLFAQFALMSLLMTGQGMIETDGRAMEESVYGWYGQLGVLIAYTDFWFVLFSILFSIALTVRVLLMNRWGKKNDVDERDTDYLKYDDERPKVTVS